MHKNCKAMCKFSESTKEKLGNALIYVAERVQDLIPIVLGILRNMPRNLLSKQETSSWFLKQSNHIYHHIKKADSSILLYKNRLSCLLDLQY